MVSCDGQMNSPEFCAKFYTYSVMHDTMYYILQVEVLQVRQSQLKSVAMGKVGCERALDALMRKRNIQELVTDAYGQIIELLGKCNFIFLYKWCMRPFFCGHTH